MLIVVDGIDGAGKSSLCSLLARELGAPDVIRPLEGSHDFARQARTIESELAEYTEALPRPLQQSVGEHYVHQFAFSVASVIAPRLARGETVICDRYWYSLVANQAQFNVDCEMYSAALSTLPTPDTAILLDCPESVAMHRARARDGCLPWYDEAFLGRVAGILRSNAPQWGLHRMDARLAPETVLNRALDLVAWVANA